MTSDINIPHLDIFRWLLLKYQSTLEIYKIKKENILSYHKYDTFLLERFDKVFLNHVPREENRIGDALANLAIKMALRKNETTKVYQCYRWVIPSFLDVQIIKSHYIYFWVVDNEALIKPLIEYLEHGRLLEDPRVEHTLRKEHHDSSFIGEYYFVFLTRDNACIVLTMKKLTMEETHILAHVEQINWTLFFI